MTIRRMAGLRTGSDFRACLDSLGLTLPFDEDVESGADAPLAQPYALGSRTIGNRFAILPLEGWDPATDGRPTDLTRRRWRRFGLSGAKLIWGGEAVAVTPEARGSPRQMVILDETVGDLADLRGLLVETHEDRFGGSDDLLVGLQLTHSGRLCRPNDWQRREQVILYHNSLLDRAFDVAPDHPVMTDDEIVRVVDDFVRAAVLTRRAGFDFVDVKHCHAYLGHEFLSAVDRPGRYGGSFENRTRFLREIVEGIRSEAPGLHIGVRLSAFDFAPFQPGEGGRGELAPAGGGAYPRVFGGDGSGSGIDLTEPLAFVDLLDELGIRLFCMSAGAGYSHHIMGPGLYSWSRGYRPPEDPLVGVARLTGVAAELKRRHPHLACVGAGYSHLQEWLPNVAQHDVRTGRVDFVGIGRMALSYPEFVTDVLEGRPLDRRRICRTCGACGAAPGHRMISGCYPFDEFYRARPEFERMKRIRRTT